MKNCASCGKDMWFIEDKKPIGKKDHLVMETCYSGISLKVEEPKKEDVRLKEFLQKQIGGFKLGKEYSFCWECWLKSLGAKI